MSFLPQPHLGFFIAIIVAAALVVSYLVWTGDYETAGFVSHDAIMAKSPIHKTACLYVIRQAVSKIIANTDAAAVERHIAQMTYEDWQQFIRTDALRDTLSNFVPLTANL